MAPPLKHTYPAGVSCEVRHIAEDRARAKRIMSNASAYAVRRGFVYRCRYVDGLVTIRRVA